MKLLEERILKDGEYREHEVLKVDCFLNHQIDVCLLNEMGKEWYRLFEGEGVTKILTIEASGIAIAAITAQYFKVPVVFAKKSKTLNIDNDFYTSQAFSYTHGNTNNIVVSKNYLSSDDRVLILDDFLARGEALMALIDICEQAGAVVVGTGAAIEKTYQGGSDRIREKGIRVESLARVSSMSEGKIEFAD